MAVPCVVKVLLWLFAGLVVLVGLVSIALISVPSPVEHLLQARVLEALHQRYGPDVQFQNLQVNVIPVFRVTLDDFVLPNRGRADLPPFMTIKHVTAEAVPLQLLRKPVHLSWVKFDGLVIRIPPKQQQPPGQTPPPAKHVRLANFEIDRVDAEGTELYVLPRQEGREPMNWELRSLRLRSAGIGQPMSFTAELTNPKPPGLIHTTGRFGPWNTNTPSETEVSGRYDFRNADLSIFNGISGILSSVGDYTGVLENIIVDGTTDTPDFKLDTGAQPVHLATQFHAVVDGTNGNTYLQPVDAHFLNSSVVAIGEVAGHKGVKGKTINLDIDIHNSRVQDMLALATPPSKPMLTGGLTAKAKLVIRPGNEKVLEKIQLKGTFKVNDARFASEKTKDTVASLSRRAQGRPDDLSIQDVPADMSGTFALRNATLSFSKLTFEIAGVNAEVKGSYGLKSETLNFTGEIKLQAHVSQTMKGAKRILFKPVDPLFARHNAGTYLPINVTGKRDDPQIKLDLKRVF